MLQCLSLQKSTSTPQTPLPDSPPPTTINLNNCSPRSPSPPQGSSTDASPRSSHQSPPTLTREYNLAIQSNSYNDMWSRLPLPDQQLEPELPQDGVAAQVLHPTREHVEEALRHARRNSLTRLVSTYFENTESTTNLYLLLHRCVFEARALYDPLHRFLSVLPLDDFPLTQSQCDLAYHIFSDFDRFDNPFPCSDSHNFRQLRNCFSLLRQQLDNSLRKSRSRVRLARRAIAGSVLCVIGSAVAIIATAIAISTHALVAFIATPVFSGVTTCACLPKNRLTEKELALVKQLDAAARGTYVLNYDLETIDRLVAWLYAVVEGDKQLVRFGLERVPEKHLVMEVLKRLRRNRVNFVDRLKELEERICLCFNAVNRARSLLLQEIHLYQTSNRGTAG